MFVLESKIEIGSYVFERVNNVEITKSVDLLSDTASITMPFSATFGSDTSGFIRKPLEEEINVGDPVKIYLGYKDVIWTLEFEGFITAIKPNIPSITFECEDAIWKIRQKTVNKSFINTSLKDVLNAVLTDTGIEMADNVPDVVFDQFIIKQANGAQALQKVKDEFGLFMFIQDDGKLYAGLRENTNFGETVNYNLQRNVISSDLTFRRAEDVRIYLKVVGVLPNNQRIEVQVGDPTGEERTIFRYSVSDTQQLRRLGEAELANLVYTGYEGSITGFLAPFCTRGQNISLSDDIYPKRAGKYFVPKVVTNYGTGGARREIEVGNRLD